MPLSPAIHALIDLALAEDLGDSGDLTSAYFVPEDQFGSAVIIAREACVVAGVEVAYEVFEKVDQRCEIEVAASDGREVEAGDRVMSIHGPTRALLTAERIALNFMQRLSGVATTTRQFVRRMATAEGSVAQLLDTRKTTPGFRELEKAAVVAGGGTNHRIGLYDAVMVKDNHLLAENSLDAIRRSIAALQADHPEVSVELETDTLDQVRDFLDLDGVTFILLDNMNTDQLREAVKMRDDAGSPIKLEASGGVELDTVADIAATGVDFISVGALTHSAGAIDLAMELEILTDA
jgi:nicotinate-nucleotide pyrophosphorylase (carboxylating)